MEIETLKINYWKEINRDLDKILENARGIIFVVHNSAEVDDIFEFLRRFRVEEEIDILYVSLMRSYYHIKLSLEERVPENKRLFILDCVSSMIMEIDEKSEFEGKKKIEGVFRKPPSTLDQLRDLVEYGIDHLKKIGISVDLIVIDSISQIVNLSFPTESDLREFYRFLEDIKRNVLGILHDTAILLYDDKLGSLRYLPVVHADHIIKMEVIRERPSWKG